MPDNDTSKLDELVKSGEAVSTDTPVPDAGEDAPTDPAPEVAPEAMKSDAGGSAEEPADSEGAAAPAPEPAPEAEAGDAQDSGGLVEGNQDGQDAGAETPVDTGVVSATDAEPPAHTDEDAPPAPEAPTEDTFGELQPAAKPLRDKLSAGALHALKEAGEHAFVFVIAMSEADVSGLESETLARLQNSRNQAMVFLNAVEAVFTRNA